MSCSFGVSPWPLMTLPRSSSAVALPMLLPGLRAGAGAGRGGQLLAMGVGAGQAAEIGPLAAAHAGDEEARRTARQLPTCCSADHRIDR
ncbi:MAG: hypothetical protein Q8M01_12515 [Rubrivivax sp.]|nr:hypothetical protein [Rubrivivax sp.]